MLGEKQRVSDHLINPFFCLLVVKQFLQPSSDYPNYTKALKSIMPQISGLKSSKLMEKIFVSWTGSSNNNFVKSRGENLLFLLVYTASHFSIPACQAHLYLFHIPVAHSNINPETPGMALWCPPFSSILPPCLKICSFWVLHLFDCVPL